MTAQTTPSAVNLLASIGKYTHNAAEVMARIAALLAEDGEPQVVSGERVVHILRNVGKPPGEEVAAGQATQPLSGAYPG